MPLSSAPVTSKSFCIFSTIWSSEVTPLHEALVNALVVSLKMRTRIKKVKKLQCYLA